MSTRTPNCVASEDGTGGWIRGAFFEDFVRLTTIHIELAIR